MKVFKKIVGTVAFLGIGIVLFFGVSYMLRPVDDNSKNDNFFRKGLPGFYGEEKDSLDVVLFGSSAISHFMNNPVLWEEYSLTAYNLGSSNQSCYALELMIDEVQKTQSPQLYIVETRKFLFAEDKSTNQKSFPYLFDNMNYSLKRLEVINYLYDDWGQRLNSYLDIISYHDSWEDFSYDNLKYIDNKIDNPTKGWKTRKKIKKFKYPELLPVEEANELPIAPATEEALVSLMKKCKKENIEVLFLATPWKINEESQRKNMYLSRIIEENGFQFLDCNQHVDEIGLDFTRDYWDTRHTNVFGSEKVTKYIGNYIQENYHLSTEHTEKVTEKWNEVAEQNQVERQALKDEILGVQ